MNQKHACLIMAHNNFDQLRTLIELLDDPRNDIYLHIDKKARDFCPDSIKTKEAGLFFVEPMPVTWGGHSQIQCELRLFKAAAAGHYLYYHLLSGVDLPIKTQDEIHAFFRQHAGENFMEIDEKEMESRSFVSRTQYYHLFRNITGKSKKPWMRALTLLEKLTLAAQKAVGFRRRELVPLYKGANWVSITDELLQWIVGSEELIRKQFFYSVCADEVFLQSVAMASPYRDSIVKNYYRAIDWERGSPYVYRREDVPALLASPAFFARKFDAAVDPEAIRLVAEQLHRSSN